MDRSSERELGRILEALPGDAILRDLVGPAVYRLEPTWLTAVLCRTCGFIHLVVSIPARPFVWACPRCAHRERLEPPAAVLAARPRIPSLRDRLARRLHIA